MKKMFFVLVFILILLTGIFAGVTQENEKEAIKKRITTAYVDGLLNKGDLEETRKGFDPGFNLLIKGNDRVNKWPIADWIKNAEDFKKNNPDGPKEKFTARFPIIDITENAAMVKIELFIGSRQVYTDYISLYKFGKDWKIVGKIYYEHK